MDFIKDLQEARMTRNSDNQRMLTYTDCKERAYLIILMLQLMRHYKSHRNAAAAYAYKTVMYREYTRFRVDGSDLYNLFYFITGDDLALDKLKDADAAKELRKHTHISVGKLNGYLRSLGASNGPSDADIVAIFQLEQELKISNNHYKEIRRRLGDYSTASERERKETVTRLLFAGRAKLSDSDFLHIFTALAQDKNLEDFTKTDPEIDISTPDIVSIDQIVNYRFLVPVTYLPYIAKFLENARARRTVVAQFVQAYLPIVLMLDDIVKAGPAYVAQLKELHKRAKRSLK